MTRAAGDAIGNWEVQLRKGVIEFVILLSLRDQEQYGFELTSGIAKQSGIEVTEGTLYPLMLRLARDEFVTSRFGEGDGGGHRKYYSLTGRGRTLLDAMIPAWSKLVQSVDHLLEGAPK